MSLSTTFQRLMLLLAVLCCSTSAMATLLAYDSFATTSDGSGGTYSLATADSRIYGQNPTAFNSGFGGAWTNTGTNSTNLIRLDSEGLNAALLAGSAQNGSAFPNSQNTVRGVARPFSSSVNSTIEDLMVNSGSLYFSGLIGGPDTVYPASGGDTRYGLADNFNSGGGAIPVGVFVQTGNSGALSLNVMGSLTSIIDMDNGTTYLFATRIDFNDSEDMHRVSLDLFTSASTSHLDPIESVTTTVSSATLLASNLSHLILQTGGTQNYSNNTQTPRFDEFRMGTSLDSIVVIPEPGTLVLLGIALGTLMLFRRRK
ncbi:MAG: PEP-CTERM sorting domain-containing protein [Kiritimatiellae bacterium]|nr:PEP-CTERM sorting domain-containing protein [Kiritimatiellia bacterium]